MNDEQNFCVNAGKSYTCVVCGFSPTSSVISVLLELEMVLLLEVQVTTLQSSKAGVCIVAHASSFSCSCRAAFHRLFPDSIGGRSRMLYPMVCKDKGTKAVQVTKCQTKIITTRNGYIDLQECDT
jgi:hypothetical protein